MGCWTPIWIPGASSSLHPWPSFTRDGTCWLTTKADIIIQARRVDPAVLFYYEDNPMNKEQKRQYQGPEVLKEILYRELYGKKFVLQCGHHITFGATLGNDLTVRNGRKLRVICAECGY